MPCLLGKKWTSALVGGTISATWKQHAQTQQLLFQPTFRESSVLVCTRAAHPHSGVCVCVCVCACVWGGWSGTCQSTPSVLAQLVHSAYVFFPFVFISHTLFYAYLLNHHYARRPSAVRIWQPIPHALRCCVLRGPDVFVRGCDLPFFLTPAVSSRNRFPLAMHAIL